MQVTTTLGPVTVISISGSIDSATFFELIQEADTILSGGHSKLVLDLGNVDFISSGGLVALQTIAVRAVSHDGKAVLCCVGDQVMKILSTTGLEKKLDIYPDVSSAKASFD